MLWGICMYYYGTIGIIGGIIVMNCGAAGIILGNI